MKKISIFLVSCITALSVFAQYNNAGTVTITVNGNRNKQVLVDGKNYSPTSTNDNSVVTNTTTIPVPIIITDLPTGQHTLQLIRTSQYNNNNNSNNRTNNTVFSTRPGYDMQIVVNNDGSIQLKEVRKRRNGNANNQYRTPMSDASFTTLLKSVQNEWRPSAKKTLVTTAFANTANYFTTAQARQLIQSVSSQSNRLQLAKASYRSITDPVNFTQVYDLLNTQAAKNELQVYVNSYASSNPGYNNGQVNNNGPVYNNSYKTPMSDASYNTIYQDVRGQLLPGAKFSALTTAFDNINNYFTTIQAQRLVLLINDQANRLQLAKSVYRNITDPANFSPMYDVFKTQAMKNELAAYVSSYSTSNSNSNSNNNNGYNNNSTVRYPMSDAGYNEIVRNVQNQWSSGAKLSALTSVFADVNNYFTTIQAKHLIELVSEEASRLQLAKASYRSLTDPANFSLLYDVLSSPVSRNELAAYVSNYNGNSGYNNNNTVRYPMSDANYNELVRNVENQWGLGAKMSALTDIFANTTNYFTTAQAKQLIGLVSDEANRLQLAKASYRNITDPANFSQMYDLLNSQSSKNDLSAYVSSYARY